MSDYMFCVVKIDSCWINYIFSPESEAGIRSLSIANNPIKNPPICIEQKKKLGKRGWLRREREKERKKESTEGINNCPHLFLRVIMLQQPIYIGRAEDGDGAGIDNLLSYENYNLLKQCVWVKARHYMLCIDGNDHFFLLFV